MRDRRFRVPLRRWWALLLIGIVSLPVGSAAGQTARLLVPTDTVQIGERFHVVLIVERPATATARIPDPALGDTVLGDLELLRVERRSRGLADGSGLARDSMRYEVTTFALDTAFVPPLEVHLFSDRDTLVVRTAPSIIPVRSVVPADAEDIQDLAPLVEFPRSLWPWILLGTILLVGAILGYLWHRRRKNRDVDAPPPPPPVPPYEEAMTRLKRLDEATLDEESDVKPFFVELSDILRTYIERRTGLPALESTSRELLRDLERAQSTGFPSTAVARVRLVLERSDLVKFADARPPSDQSRETAAQVREIVDEIERAQAAADERMNEQAERAVEA